MDERNCLLLRVERCKERDRIDLIDNDVVMDTARVATHSAEMHRCLIAIAHVKHAAPMFPRKSSRIHGAEPLNRPPFRGKPFEDAQRNELGAARFWVPGITPVQEEHLSRTFDHGLLRHRSQETACGGNVATATHDNSAVQTAVPWQAN